MNPTIAAAQLARNAGVFEAQFAGLAPNESTWRPSSGGWSLLEILAHLEDEERLDFRTRIEALLERPGTEWDPIDPEGWVLSHDYAAKDLDETLESFLSERARSVEWLEDLGEIDAERVYAHPHLGPLRVGDLLTSWVAHDYLHLRQITARRFAWNAAQHEPFSPKYAGDW